MDDVRQEHVVDASLALLRKLEDDIRVLNGSPKTSHQQLGSSDSSRTMESPNVAERKRKRIDLASSSEDEVSKKLRVSSADQDSLDFGPAPYPRHDMSRQLPAETWQHIFSLLSPHTLGALLHVSRLFHKYLDPASPFKVSAPVFHVPSILPALSPDAIWRASRCLFLPKMPAPLRGKSELDMWRFACSRSCQICGQLDKTDTARHSLPWRRGPGNKTVTPIFLFFTNTCGNCLIEKSVKEVDLLLSTSVPSIVLPGLPMVFLTPDVNVVSPQEIRNATVPASVQLTKIYWPAQVESLQAELEDVKRFGLAATEEWIKGLESRGTETIHDASRWERWRLSGGLRQMFMRSYSISPASATDMVVRSGIQELEKSDTDVHLPVNHLPRRNPKRRAREVVEELQSERRADLEARAARLQPPIPPSVLSNLPSFQAALQKAEPVDGKEWKLLKPRLLAQYKMFFNKERKSATNTSTQQKLQHEISGQNAKELKNQHDGETLLRIHICSLAEQIINDRWGGGRNVKKTNCAYFATEVLSYVRKQFYSESSHTNAASLTRRLTLDDMRWIFETKIGPLTNHHRKEFFFCNGCPNSKLYGFHAVVQHYAMKHATIKNSMTLHWKEEWPEEPPFRSSTIQQASAVNFTPQHADDKAGISSSGSRVDNMARVLKTTWKAIKNARNIPSSVKIYTLIHHVAKEYQEQYLEPAPFEVFLDGLGHHSSFSAISNSQGLVCKLCMVSQKQDQDRKKAFSLSTLANHFHGVHYKERTPPADWRVDMVWLPDMETLQGLRAHIRDNKRVFELISDALPWLFRSEEENSHSGFIPSQTWQSTVTAGMEAVEANPTPVMQHFSDEKFLAIEDFPSLLPASAVYTRLDIVHEEPGYSAGIPGTQSTSKRRFEGPNVPNNMSAQYTTRVADMESGSSWEPVHIGSRIGSPRDVVPESRRHLSTYYLHRERQPHLAEGPSNYPYYPDMESQRERGYVEARTRYIDSRYYMPEGYQQPTPPAPIYRYVESIPSYDRYGVVDLRDAPNGYYSRHPTMLHENRVPSNTGHSNYTTWEPHNNNTMPASRVYDAYASRYTLTNRPGGLDYNIE